MLYFKVFIYLQVLYCLSFRNFVKTKQQNALITLKKAVIEQPKVVAAEAKMPKKYNFIQRFCRSLLGLDDLSDDISNIKNEFNDVKRDISTLTNKIDDLGSEFSSLTADMRYIKNEIKYNMLRKDDFHELGIFLSSTTASIEDSDQCLRDGRTAFSGKDSRDN